MPDGAGIQRVERIQDVEDDLSDMPHVTLSRARVHDFFLEAMAKSPRRLLPSCSRELVGLTRNGRKDFPIEAELSCLEFGDTTETVFAQYVVGCDGARSAVRKFMGLDLGGEAARQLWGVMDVLCVTDFPDIRLKCAIQSTDQGSLLIIPREGGYLARMYIELDALREGERAADRGVTGEMLIEKAQAIFAPFSMDAKEIAWWSAYETGQRVCDRFDDGRKGKDRGSSLREMPATRIRRMRGMAQMSPWPMRSTWAGSLPRRSRGNASRIFSEHIPTNA